MKSEIKKGAVLGYVNLASTILVTFLYTPIMLKLLGQSEYGLYSLVTSVVAYLSVLDMGFGNAMIRYVSKSLAREEKEKEKSINGMFFVLYCIMLLGNRYYLLLFVSRRRKSTILVQYWRKSHNGLLL